MHLLLEERGFAYQTSLSRSLLPRELPRINPSQGGLLRNGLLRLTIDGVNLRMTERHLDQATWRADALEL